MAPAMGGGGNGGGGGNEDVLIGKCEVSMMSWISKGSFEGDLEIKNKRNKVSGVVQMKMTFNNPRDKEKQRPPPRTVRINYLCIYLYSINFMGVVCVHLWSVSCVVCCL